MFQSKKELKHLCEYIMKKEAKDKRIENKKKKKKRFNIFGDSSSSNSRHWMNVFADAILPEKNLTEMVGEKGENCMGSARRDSNHEVWRL